MGDNKSLPSWLENIQLSCQLLGTVDKLKRDATYRKHSNEPPGGLIIFRPSRWGVY